MNTSTMTTMTQDPGLRRYAHGDYAFFSGDADWKSEQMMALLAPHLGKIRPRHVADVGCGDGGVFCRAIERLDAFGARPERAVGFEVLPLPEMRHDRLGLVTYERRVFTVDDGPFDLVFLNDVLEHMTAPIEFLRGVGERARYVALHLPLDDRWSVWLAGQLAWRLREIGHISFWNPATAVNIATAAGLMPIDARFTPGFLAPSGRERIIQRLALPVRRLAWWLSPALTTKTIGGVSLALLCRGRLP